MDRIKRTIRIMLLSVLCMAGVLIQTTVVSAASADNSLSTLTLSEGTLSPSFAYNVVNYTASVSADTANITVDAKASNQKASIQSGVGSYDLKEGENTIRIVVAAENGNLATYTIKVTRGGASTGSSDTSVDNIANTANTTDANTANATNGDAEGDNTADANVTTVTGADGYTVADKIPETEVPAGFTAATVTYQEKECPALKFEKGDVTLLYMVDAEKKGMLFVYDAQAGAVYPFVKLTAQDRYLILLQAPADDTLGEGYASAELSIDNKSVPSAVQNSALNTPDFYQVYGIDNEGNTGWYQYDSIGETYQRYQPVAVQETPDVTASEEYQFLQNAYNELSQKYSELKSRDTRFIAVLIVVIAVLLIVIVNLIIFRKDKGGRRKVDSYEEALDQFEDFDEEVEQKPKKKKEKKKRVARKNDIFDDEADIDFYEEETITKSAGARETSSSEDDLEIMDLNDL